MSMLKEFTKGLWKENPTFVLVLGLCPTLAVTTSLNNAVGMGLATTFVLVCSNIVISAVRRIVPDNVRIPVYVVIIAGFVSIVEMVMAAYLPALYDSLGLFISLIVVNCIILGRAEAFANKNTVLASLLDGLGMGLGFIIGLSMIGSVREILGAGTLTFELIKPLSFQLSLGQHFHPAGVMVLAPGGFLTMGSIIGLIAWSKQRRAARQ